MTVALVTGSGSGMGLAVAKRLTRDHAIIAVNDRTQALVDSGVDEICATGGQAVGYKADATRREDVDSLVMSVLRDHGRIDALVNVVGGIAGPVIGNFWEISDHDWDATLRVNLSSAFYSMRAVAPTMMGQRSGRIVNVSSVSWGGDAARAHYSASKAGVVALTRSVSAAVAGHGVTANVVAPGRTSSGHGGRTDMALPDDVPPTGRINTPADVAEAVAFLASEKAAQISGQLIVVAGGRNPSL